MGRETEGRLILQGSKCKSVCRKGAVAYYDFPDLSEKSTQSEKEKSSQAINME